jgi:hypothetical protein
MPDRLTAPAMKILIDKGQVPGSSPSEFKKCQHFNFSLVLEMEYGNSW